MSTIVISPTLDQSVSDRHVLRVRFSSEVSPEEVKVSLDSVNVFQRGTPSELVSLIDIARGARFNELSLRTKSPLKPGLHIISVMTSGKASVVGHRFWVGPTQKTIAPPQNRSECGTFWIDERGRWFCNGVDTGIVTEPHLEAIGVLCALDRQNMVVTWADRGRTYKRALQKRLRYSVIKAARRGLDINILTYHARSKDLRLLSLDDEQRWSCAIGVKQIGVTQDWLHVAAYDYTLHWPATYYTGSVAHMDEWLVVHAPTRSKSWRHVWTEDDHMWWSKKGYAVSFARPELIKSNLEAVVWSREDIGLGELESMRSIGAHMFIANENTIIDTKNIRVRPA